MLRKHSISIQGHSTSFSLEDEFYSELKLAAERKKIPLARLIRTIDTEREHETNLSSAIRLFVLSEVKKQATA
ncbi:MAG: ribbon-helix-helix domain-containing protein [Pseudomonadota bacterium]